MRRRRKTKIGHHFWKNGEFQETWMEIVKTSENNIKNKKCLMEQKTDVKKMLDGHARAWLHVSCKVK